MLKRKMMSAVVAGVMPLLYGHSAFACNEVPDTRVIQSGAGTCTPTSTSFSGAGVPIQGTVVAQGEGAVINIAHDTLANSIRGGGSGAGFHALGGSAATPAQLNSPSNVTLHAISSTRQNSHGFRAGSHGILNIDGDIIGESRENEARIILATANGRINIGGSADLTIAATSGANSRAISLEGDVASTFVNISGDVNVVSYNSTGRGVRFSNGNLTIGGHFDIDLSAGGNNGIYITGGLSSTGFINLNTLSIQAGSGPAIDASGGGVELSTTGESQIHSPATAGSVIGINLGHTNAHVNLGPNSSITMEGGIKTAVYQSGGASFQAGTGLEIETTQFAFNYVNSTPDTATVLDNASITAPVIWNADAASTVSFTGNNGVYNGTSAVIPSGNLDLTIANNALWEVTDSPSFSTLRLQSGGTFDAVFSNSALSATGNLINQGGIVTLTQSDPSPSNTLTLNGTYTANGGSLAINTVLNDASTSISDVLIVDEVVAGIAPTAISVTPHATSAGALTTGDGILVVQVSGGATASADNAFVLSSPVNHAGFQYDLVRASNGNWYLQATRTTPPPSSASTTPVPSLGMLAVFGLSTLIGLFSLRRRRKAHH